MILHDDDLATIDLDPSRSFMRLRWKRFAHGAAYRGVLERSLALIIEHQVRYWLADGRRMGPILYDDEQWSIKEITPRFQSTGLKRLAIIPDNDLFNQMSVERMVEITAPGSPYQLAYFREVADAEAWLFGEERAIA